MTELDEQSPTCRLFGMPSLLEGLAMAVDVSGAMPEFNTSENSALADGLAIASDWRAVAADLQTAFGSMAVRMR